MLFLVHSRTGAIPNVPDAILVLNGLAVAIYVIVQLLANADAGRESRVRLAQAQQQASTNPDNLNLAWNLAAATLENYLDRNLSQVKWIFNIAVLVMVCGFAILGYSVSLAVHGSISASVATSVTGLITQFISATFMFIYRSTMNQASSNIVLLERLNGVGTAVQLVGKISDASASAKDSLNAQIISHLMTSHSAHPNISGKGDAQHS